MFCEHCRGALVFAARTVFVTLAALAWLTWSTPPALAQSKAPCKEMRKVKFGVSVSPPNVVHTPIYVARALGIFAKYCIDAEIVEFEGGASAADLKGKRLSATGGGVGGFNWVMGREVLKTAGLTIDDAQFVSSATAGRLPGLIAGQVNGVALHPEDVYLAQKEKPGLHVLVDLAKLMPKYFFNAYGAADSLLAKDRAMVRDVATALIETNRLIYRQKEKVIPTMVQATQKPQEAVAFAYD